MPSKRRGALVAVEGLDRAGKSTQHEKLCARLEGEGFPVKRMKFPGTALLSPQPTSLLLCRPD